MLFSFGHGIWGRPQDGSTCMFNMEADRLIAQGGVLLFAPYAPAPEESGGLVLTRPTS